MSDEAPLFSRSGDSDPNGKLTRRLDVPCTEHLEDAVGAMAVTLGYGSKAEYVRAVLEKELFGAVAFIKSKLPEARRG